MRLKCPSSIAIFAVTLFSLALLPAMAQTTNPGPRSDLQIFYYPTDAALYSALKIGEIDMSLWETTPTQYQDAIADPNILLAPTSRLDVRSFSLNLNDTIKDYRGVRNPLTVPEFRKAIHRLSNVEYYVNTVCQGFAVRLPVTIAAPSFGWYNASVVNYASARLSYDVDGAKALLDAAGFLDHDGDGWRNYPAGWSCVATPTPNLHPIKFYIRSDDILRKQAGLDLAANMEAVGIPVDGILAPFATAYTYVMSMRNYHIYTSGFSVGRFPTYLWSWFHSSRWFPGGSNYHVPPRWLGVSELDPLLAKVMYPPSYEEAMKAAKDAQYLITEKYTIMIPLWSSKTFYPYRSDVLGLSNRQATGPENEYTYIKAWRIPGGPIRVGEKGAPLSINPVWENVEWGPQGTSTKRPFMEDFLSQAPYNIMFDQPWLVQDWSSPPETWFNGGVETTKMTFWFKDDSNDELGDNDAEWIEPVTGNVLDDFTHQWLEGGGYEFNCWYHDQYYYGGWLYGEDYEFLHHIRVYPAERKAEVYFNVKSYWAMYSAQTRLIYSPAWKKAPLATLETRVFNGPITAGTNLPLTRRTIGAPVEIVNITRSDGMLMTKANGALDNDYEMVSGKIRLYKAVPAGVSITVKYWARGDAAGYAPGNLFISGTRVGQAWIGSGSFYVTEHVPGAGGWTSYKRNLHHFLKTTPKGEIDFWWHWTQEPKPRSGYFKVDILDLVKATWALDSRGYAVPSPNWDSGADLTQEVKKGLVTVHDITLVASDFGETLGSPATTPSLGTTFDPRSGKQGEP